MVNLNYKAGEGPQPVRTGTMDEQFTIREAVIALMAASPAIDETNAIEIHRRVVALAARKQWELDTLDDDFRVSERADWLLKVVLPTYNS